MVGIVALIGIFVVGPLVGTHQSLELIPIAAIGATTALFWRPVQALTRRWEQNSPPTDVSGIERRLTAIETQLEESLREQSRLEETVRWQEQLLHRTMGQPANGPSSRV